MFVKENTPGRKKVYEQKNAIQKDYTLGNYYISEEKYKTMKSFIAEPGDIIVSCAGTIGEIYILPEEAETGVINQALMRIKLFQREIEKYFILYFDSVLKKEANDKGNGTGMKNIPPFDVLKKMLLPLPPEQEIKRILDKIETINSKISIIANSFKSLLDYVQSAKSKILDSIFGQNSSYKSYYPKNYLLGEILEYEQPGPYIVSSTDYNDEYKTPVLTPGKTFILGYTNEKEGIYHVDSKVIIFDDFTTASRLVNFDFKVKSSAMKILHSIDENKFNIDYMYYLLQTIKVISDTHKRFWISEYAPKRICMHTYEEQLKIVDIIHSSFGLLDSIIE